MYVRVEGSCYDRAKALDLPSKSPDSGLRMTYGILCTGYWELSTRTSAPLPPGSAFRRGCAGIPGPRENQVFLPIFRIFLCPALVFSRLYII